MAAIVTAGGVVVFVAAVIIMPSTPNYHKLFKINILKDL